MLRDATTGIFTRVSFAGRLRQDPLALTRIAEAVAKARKEIDSAGATEISLPYITANARGPKHFMLKVTREQVAALPQQMI